MTWTDIAVIADHPKAHIEEAALLADLAKSEISKAWVFGGGASTTNDFDGANSAVLELARRNPATIVPIGVINPFHVARDAANWVDRGLKGFRVLTNWGNWISLNNVRELVVPLARLMRDARLPLIVALEGFSPMTGGSVALPLILRRECPGVCLILDHCWSPLGWADYLAFAAEFPDVWVTLHGLPQMLLRHAVAELGTRRILAGSWYPEADPDLVYLQIARAVGSGVDLGAVLTANAERALAGKRASDD